MTLAELTLPLNLGAARSLALVFTPQLAGRLAKLHAQYGSRNCVPVPIMLADGRLLLGADLLTEIEPGGLLHAMWEHADKEVLGREVEVLPWAEAVSLLPPQPPLP